MRVDEGLQVSVPFASRVRELIPYRPAQLWLEHGGMTVVIACHRVALDEVSVANEDATGLGRGAIPLAGSGGVGTLVRASRRGPSRRTESCASSDHAPQRGASAGRPGASLFQAVVPVERG